MTTGTGDDSISIKGNEGARFDVHSTAASASTVRRSTLRMRRRRLPATMAATEHRADGETSVSLFNLEHLTFIGGTANDTLSGDTGNDTLKGNGGDDTLDGEAGNDTIFGGIGNDSVTGGTGTNVLNGDAGDDTMFDSGQGSTINGGTGIDKLTLDRSTVASNMAVNFVSGAAFSVADGGTTNVSLVELLSMTTGTGDDSISVKGMSAPGSTFIDGGLVSTAPRSTSACDGCGGRQLWRQRQYLRWCDLGVAVQSGASHLHRRLGQRHTVGRTPATTH
jgi:Ca2+-binding RTX toxin-like protein